MSLYRQLWLALILTTVLAVIGSLLASTISTRAYLAEQLRLKNSDNATALALNLSRGGVDPIEIELTTSAMFDTGHYELIRIIDPAGKPLVERLSSDVQQQAPAWFARLLPIAAPAGEALISDGWRQVGKVTLLSHSRFANAALWQSTMLLILTLTLTGALAGGLGTLILRRLKRPLDSVTQQAKAITERRFVTSPEPDVPELRQLSSAMNFAVTRLKAMFAEEAARLESVRKEANHDPVTGLANRRYFMAGLSSLLSSPEAPSGTLMIIRLTRLAEMNQALGHRTTDRILHAVGQALLQRTRHNPDAIAARLNGPDFALLLPGETALYTQAQQIVKEVEAQIKAQAEDATVYLGFGEYRQGMELSQVLAQVDNALAKAESSPQSAIRASEAAAESARGEAQWAISLRRALDQGWTKLASFPVKDFAGKPLHRECPLRLRLDAQGEWRSAGEFLPMAERLDTTADIDLTAVAHALAELDRDSTLPDIAINLSGRSLIKRGFKQRLTYLLDEYPQAARRLWLEIPEAGALAYLAEFEEFCQDVKLKGCMLGMEHCGNQSGQLGRFHGLPLDYLKIDARFIRDIDQHQGNQAFVKGLAAMAHGIGLRVIGEGVTTHAELDMLRALGLDGATGPVVQD
jgi:diguanylate cyclase (GGDEF)-like protein